jgi:hypothetical protein
MRRAGDAVFHPQSGTEKSWSGRVQRKAVAISIPSGQVFWLPVRPTCRAFPSRLRTVAVMRRSSTVTAAGPQRIHTVFPIKLHKRPLDSSRRKRDELHSWRWHYLFVRGKSVVDYARGIAARLCSASSLLAAVNGQVVAANRLRSVDVWARLGDREAVQPACVFRSRRHAAEPDWSRSQWLVITDRFLPALVKPSTSRLPVLDFNRGCSKDDELPRKNYTIVTCMGCSNHRRTKNLPFIVHHS